MDKVFQGFLERQLEEGMALAARSALLELEPVDRSAASSGSLPDRYIAHYRCRGLVRARAGEIGEADRFDVGVWFPPEYLRCVNPFEVVTWLAPAGVFHPNIGPGPGGRIFMCIGRLHPGTPLVDILTQCFEIITYQKVTMREDDAVNHEACVWTRANLERFPIDSRSLLGHAIVTRELAGATPPAGEVAR